MCNSSEREEPPNVSCTICPVRVILTSLCPFNPSYLMNPNREADTRMQLEANQKIQSACPCACDLNLELEALS